MPWRSPGHGAFSDHEGWPEQDLLGIRVCVPEQLEEAVFPSSPSGAPGVTLLDEAGLPIALAANQLGHADPSMTARVYLGRKGSTSAAAAVL
jgi:hypothetical protein